MSEDQQQPPLDMNHYVENTIPKALSELMDNHSKMQQISNYCKSAYTSGADTNQIYEQTQSYAKNALLNVAYHIQNIGSHISTLLDLQTNEIKKITSEIESLSQKVTMVHEISGTSVFSSIEAAKPYKSALKEKKVEVDSAKPPTKFVRRQVNYGSGEGVLDRSPSSANLNNSSSLPPPPPSSLSQSNISSNSSTPTYQSPTYSPQPHPPTVKTNKPPPPSLSVPPTIPRPPSTNFSTPPPPVSGLPPPVSNGFLPPPPSVTGLPPPPPSFSDLPPPPIRPISHYGYDLSDLPPPPPPQ